MFRHVLVGIGVLEFVAPKRLVEASERLAFENPDAGQLRRWTIPMARLEAAVFSWFLVREEGPPTIARPLLAALGLVMALFPRSTLEAGLAMAYENSSELEVKPWVVPLTRVLGSLYLVVGLGAGRADAPADVPGADDAREP